MKAAAETLGMSQDELLAALQDGKSLADVAEDQGAALDDLTAALKADMPPELAATGGPQVPPPAGGRGFAASRLDGSTSGVFGSSLTSSQQTTLDELSSLLDTDRSSLLDSLRSGTSLGELVSRKGVSGSALSAVLQDGLLVDTRA
jgi:lambda repressor-like predicted transcriptional regulator